MKIKEVRGGEEFSPLFYWSNQELTKLSYIEHNRSIIPKSFCNVLKLQGLKQGNGKSSRLTKNIVFVNLELVLAL